MNLDSGPIIVVNALPETIPTVSILPKPVPQKEIPGKIAILPLKSKSVPRRQRIRRTKKEIERERKRSKESKLLASQKEPADVDHEDIVSDGNKCDNNQTNQNSSTTTTDAKAKLQEMSEPDNSRIETTEPTLPQHELSNDILASLQIPQNDSNNESMSPTAAFLMSFPVVSSAGVRIGDDEQETHDSQSLQQSHSTSKAANETNILENISSLLTTKDYERFVEDAVKNDCEANAKSISDSPNDICIEKRGLSSMSFDFQLKPIISSCAGAEVKEDLHPRTSVTCTSTYLPEIGNLSYKSSPTKRPRLKSTNDENFTNIANVSMSQDNAQSTSQIKTPTVSTEDYMRNHSAMDFITSSSTILHNLEPPTKILRLDDTMEQQKRGETTSFENLFLRNPPSASSSVATSNTYSTVYSYDKISTVKADSKISASESGNYNTATSIPSIVSRVTDPSHPKSRKIAEPSRECFSFPQPLAVSTVDTIGSSSTSIKHCRENQVNSLYSYPTNTTTYSSTSISQVSGGTEASPLRPYQDNTAKSVATTSIDKTFYKPNHSTSSATDGFYNSLTSIGTTHSTLPQYPSSIMRPNMYTSALSLSSSSSYQKPPFDYAPQTPFTFSLTTSTISNAKNTSCSQQSQNYLPTTHSTSYQDYNPFAFENISSISAPITPYSACREASQFSFSLTSTTNKVTSKNPSQSFSIDQNFLTESRMKPTAPVKAETHLEKKISYKHCSKDEASHPSEEIKIKESVQKVEKLSNTKQHVNWMTSTTDLQKNDYPIIPPLDYTQPNHYLPQPTSQLPSTQKNPDIYFGHQIAEENFQWSPNKMIDTPHINSTTLPNLHGDLALNNSMTPKPQVSSVDKNKNSKTMISTHMHQPQQNVVSHSTSSYFSVSQLVDHPKTVGQSKSYEDTVLQQKTVKTSNNQSRFKHKDSKKVAKSSSNVSNFTPNIFVESFAYNEPQKQNSYSAEALIHPSKKESKSLPNYANQPEYCNQLDTYNNMDYINESNYNYYNNSYFPQIADNEYFCSGTYSDQQFHSKTSRTSAPATKHLGTIGDTTYGSHTSQNNLYSFPHPSGKLCQQSSQYKNSSQLSTPYNQSRSYPNTNTKKQFKQDIFPSYDPNSSTNYFTPSLNINTPIIPHPPLIPTPNIPSNEDFNYLNYPTSLSKTSTPYPTTTQQMNENTQSNVMLHGNVGGGSAGNLVTNFNLSTICPEINDKTRQQNW